MHTHTVLKVKMIQRRMKLTQIFGFDDFPDKHPVRIPVSINAMINLFGEPFTLKFTLVELMADKCQIGLFKCDGALNLFGCQSAGFHLVLIASAESRDSLTLYGILRGRMKR